MRSLPHFALRRLLSLATALSAFGLASSASAALLTPAHEAQLEAWLGQGDLDLTNIYTKAAGDDSLDFHAAVDGKGPTFTLISIYGNAGNNIPSISAQIIGGYNPQSWSSSGPYYGTHNFTPGIADRTAFIYNLTSGYRQLQSTNHSFGSIQTGNHFSLGPSFGGSDIEIYSGLNYGTSDNYGYGNTFRSNYIISGSPNYFELSYPSFVFSVADIEVYTFAPAGTQGVPDTECSFLLIGASLLGLAALRRRR